MQSVISQVAVILSVWVRLGLLWWSCRLGCISLYHVDLVSERLQASAKIQAGTEQLGKETIKVADVASKQAEDAAKVCPPVLLFKRSCGVMFSTHSLQSGCCLRLALWMPAVGVDGAMCVCF